MPSAGQRFKRCGKQGIASQKCRGLTVGSVAGGAAAAHIIIIHAGQVVVNQGIAMQHLQPRGIARRKGGIAAQHVTGSNTQNGAHSLATAQKAVARRFAHAGTRA